MEKDNIIKILAGVIVILLIGWGVSINKNRTTDVLIDNGEGESLLSTTTTNISTTTTSKATINKPKTTTLLSSKCNFKITYPTAGSIVEFPLTIKGTIDRSDTNKYECIWEEIFTRAGTVQLFYNLRNSGWKSPGVAIPIVTSATTYTSSTSTITFSVGLNFFNAGIGLPSGSPIKITFIENNEKPHSPLDSFDFFVYLK